MVEHELALHAEPPLPAPLPKHGEPPVGRLPEIVVSAPRLVPLAPDRTPPKPVIAAPRRRLLGTRRGSEGQPGRGPRGAGCLWWILLPCALLALLLAMSHHHHHENQTQTSVHPATPPGTGPTNPGQLSGVGLPNTAPGNVPVPAVRMVLTVDRSALGPGATHRELRSLSQWLTEHERPTSRFRVLDGSGLSRPVTAGSVGYAHLRPLGDARGLATRWAATSPAGTVPVSVVVGDAAPLKIFGGKTAAIALRPGAENAQLDEADPRRANMVAAAVARNVIAATGAREATGSAGG